MEVLQHTTGFTCLARARNSLQGFAFDVAAQPPHFAVALEKRFAGAGRDHREGGYAACTQVFGNCSDVSLNCRRKDLVDTLQDLRFAGSGVQPPGAVDMAARDALTTHVPVPKGRQNLGGRRAGFRGRRHLRIISTNPRCCV